MSLENAYFGRVDPLYVTGGIYLQLNLFPRATFKTSVVTVGWPLWIFHLDDPPLPTDSPDMWTVPPSFNGKKGYDQRILLLGETDEKVLDFVTPIKANFERNGLLHSLYGSRVPPNRYDRVWSREKMTVLGRQDRMSKEPSITTGSLRSAKVGGHYDICIPDDIVSNRTVNSPDMLRTAFDLHENLQPILSDPPMNLLVYNGTRWHDGDLYGHVIDTYGDRANIFQESAERDEEEIAAGKAPLFFPFSDRGPELDEKYLEGKKLAMTPWFFQAQYNNRVIDSETAMFKKSYFENTMFELHEIRDAIPGMVIIQTIDPAISKEKVACNAVVLTCGWDPNGHVWLLDLFREKEVHPNALLEESFRQNHTWSPYCVGLETKGFQIIYQYNADQMSQETGVYPPFVECKDGGRSKDMRILGLEPICRSGRFHWQKQHEAIIQEFLRFPRGTYRDAIDALAYHLDLAYRGRPFKDAEPVKTGVHEYAERQHKKMLADLHITGYRVNRTDWYNR